MKSPNMEGYLCCMNFGHIYTLGNHLFTNNFDTVTLDDEVVRAFLFAS